MIYIFNRKASNSILFEEEKIVYKNRTMYSNNVSIKYFKFYISILEECLVIPKIYINGYNSSIICYLSKKDIKKLKKWILKLEKYKSANYFCMQKLGEFTFLCKFTFSLIQHKILFS